MRLIDIDSIDTTHSDPEVVETLQEADPINAVPVSEIKDIIAKINQRYPGQLMYNGKYMISVEEVTNILNGVIENAETKCTM